MNALCRVTAGSAAALALLSLSPHPGPAQEPRVIPPARAARPAKTVEMEVPPGMPIVLEVGTGSKSDSDAGESWVEGDATITLGRNVIAKNGDPQETLRLMQQARSGDALRLRIRHSRVTVATGQPYYPSHIFIEPLPSAAPGT